MRISKTLAIVVIAIVPAIAVAQSGQIRVTPPGAGLPQIVGEALRARMRLLGILPASVDSTHIATTIADSTHHTLCPMPVVKPDSQYATSRMVAKVDASTVEHMPVLRSTCVNPLAR